MLVRRSEESGPWGALVWNIPSHPSRIPDRLEGRYKIPASDALAMVAMAVGEGDVWESMQTIAQRWVQLHTTRRFANAYPTLAALVAGYNQPNNPDFLEGGKRCPVPDGGDCSPFRLKRRAWLQGAQSFDELRAGLPGNMSAAEAASRVALAIEWLRGEARTDKVPGAVHFAIHNRMRGRSDTTTDVHRSRTQTFATVSTSDNWSVDAVRIETAGALAGADSKAAALILGGVVAAGVATALLHAIEVHRSKAR